MLVHANVATRMAKTERLVLTGALESPSPKSPAISLRVCTTLRGVDRVVAGKVLTGIFEEFDESVLSMGKPFKASSRRTLLAQ